MTCYDRVDSEDEEAMCSETEKVQGVAERSIVSSLRTRSEIAGACSI